MTLHQHLSGKLYFCAFSALALVLAAAPVLCAPTGVHRSGPERSVGAATGFNPASVPNLTLWLDGADSSTIAQSAGKLSQWRDKNAGANTVSQSTASAQPGYNGSGLNGLGTVVFDGASSYLVSANSAFTKSVYPASTLFIVQSSGPDTKLSATVWSGHKVNGYPRWGFGLPSASLGRLFFGGANDRISYPKTVDFTQPAIFDGGESVALQRGYANYNGTSVGAIGGGITADTGSSPLAIGARFQASPTMAAGFAKAQVGEILAYGRLLTTPEIQTVEGYLACKWGLQSRLPSTHPYRVSCPNPIVDNVTYHGDGLRTGWNSNETLLATSNVGSSKFGRLATVSVDGVVDAQPLIAAQENIPNQGLRDLLVVATENDSVYAFDAGSGQPVWQRSFLNAQLGVAPVSTQDIAGCDNVRPFIGITGTPVIDRASDTIYVSAQTNERGVFHHRLHALALTTGLDKVTPADIAGSFVNSQNQVVPFVPQWERQRASLVEANGNVYVAFASMCDFRTDISHGWLFGFNGQTLAQLARNDVFSEDVSPNNYYLDSIWGSGFGPAADAPGAIYAVTGNGPYDGLKNFGESVVKVSNDLTTLLGTFTRNNQAVETANDADFGSGGVMLLPDQTAGQPHVAIVEGKTGVTYVLNRDSLGGYSGGPSFPDKVLSETGVACTYSCGLWGGPAYFVGSTGQPFVVAADAASGPHTFAFNSATDSLVLAHSSGTALPGEGGAIPVVSSNGLQSGTAIVWLTTRQTPSFALQAFDGATMKQILNVPGAGAWENGDGGPFITPTVANGKVYVGSNGQIAIFGLTGTLHANRMAHASLVTRGSLPPSAR